MMMEGEEDNASLYQLASVIVHHGTSTNTGHYTAFVYDPTRDEWTHRNDMRVRVVSAEYVASQEAYILIYQRPPRREEIVVDTDGLHAMGEEAILLASSNESDDDDVDSEAGEPDNAADGGDEYDDPNVF